jgi:hypothetical protein
LFVGKVPHCAANDTKRLFMEEEFKSWRKEKMEMLMKNLTLTGLF